MNALTPCIYIYLLSSNQYYVFLFAELRLEVMEELFRLDHTGATNTSSSVHAGSINNHGATITGGSSGGPCGACSELSTLGTLHFVFCIDCPLQERNLLQYARGSVSIFLHTFFCNT